MSGLRTPVTDVYGEKQSVPILSARSFETPRYARTDLDAGAMSVVVMPPGAQAVEISVQNRGSGAALVTFVSAPEDEEADAAANLAALDDHGFPRRVPAGAQMVEFRGVAEGDRFILHTDAPVTYTLHVQRGGA